MSGIAEVLHNLGYRVQGSDLADSANVRRLRELGIPVAIGHEAENLAAAEVVVISSAVKSDNPEVAAARARRLPVVRRAEMLGELMRLKWSLAVAGTHGKTTTTSMIGSLLETAQLDPTVINGGIINAYGTNTRLGAGDWMVVEADESDGTFTRLPATIAIVTNIDPEHLDFYGDFDALRRAFETFVGNIPFYGFAALCIDHPVVQGMIPKLSDRRVLTYGFSPQADIRAVDVRLGRDGARFDMVVSDGLSDRARTVPELFLPMFGRHNVQNSLAAVAVAEALGLGDEALRAALRNFKGVKRRFTKTGEWNGVTVIDDYGHHPVEIAAVLKAARAIVEGKVIAVVQPHRFTRVLHLFDGFCTCFNDADIVLVADIYAAGEAPIEGVSREALVAGLIEHGHRNVRPLADPMRSGPARWRDREAWRYGRVPGGGLDHQLGKQPAGRACCDRRRRAVSHDRAMRTAVFGIDRQLPSVRGRLTENAAIGKQTWFGVGGPAEILFRPADAADLAAFLAALPAETPVTVIGVGSNLLVRDGGIPGVTIRLGRGLGTTVVTEEVVYVGAGALDRIVALAAAKAGLAGLEFLSGIPGTIGGSLRMNAGAYGGEVKDVLVSATALDRHGRSHVIDRAAMALAYRRCEVDPGWIFVEARLRGIPGERAAIMARLNEIRATREATQPVRARTAGSTFANPPGEAAWRLIDAAGCRGLARGGADGFAQACQFPDQYRQCHGGRSRRPRRRSAPARLRNLRDHAGVGDPADRPTRLRSGAGRSGKRRLSITGWPCTGKSATAISTAAHRHEERGRADGRLVARARGLAYRAGTNVPRRWWIGATRCDWLMSAATCRYCCARSNPIPT